MDPENKHLVHLCCAVPYRRAADQIEFFLIRAPTDRAWELPMATVDPKAAKPLEVLQQALSRCGLSGHVVGNTPLGQFWSSRGNTNKEITAFLVEATLFDESRAAQADLATRWCLAEEVKVRIRRKPLRRLVDLAIRRLEDDLTLDLV
jgi:hypothetical protein